MPPAGSGQALHDDRRGGAGQVLIDTGHRPVLHGSGITPSVGRWRAAAVTSRAGWRRSSANCCRSSAGPTESPTAPTSVASGRASRFRPVPPPREETARDRLTSGIPTDSRDLPAWPADWVRVESWRGDARWRISRSGRSRLNPTDEVVRNPEPYPPGSRIGVPDVQRHNDPEPSADHRVCLRPGYFRFGDVGVLVWYLACLGQHLPPPVLAN